MASKHRFNPNVSLLNHDVAYRLLPLEFFPSTAHFDARTDSRYSDEGAFLLFTAVTVPPLP